jgi:FtsZ-binding cell division protein ZapB
VQTPNEQQPDKALPIPAHQLKKNIADKPKNDALEKGLDEKIQAANQAIAALDKELDKEPDKTLPQSASSAEPNSTELSSTVTEDEKSEDIKKRLQHLRDHLNKQP